VEIVELTNKFIDFENFGTKSQSFGRFDKGEEAIFEMYQSGDEKPIRVRFFISFLDRMAHPNDTLDENKLYSEAKKLLEELEVKGLKTKELLYLYNFSMQEFQLLE